jgi:hypothetical protein
MKTTIDLPDELLIEAKKRAAEQRVIALDTNLLIYAHRENTPEHPKARKAILEAQSCRRLGHLSANEFHFSPCREGTRPI